MDAVYIVESGEYSDRRIEEVCSTYEKAVEVCDKYIRSQEYPDNVKISCYPVDGGQIRTLLWLVCKTKVDLPKHHVCGLDHMAGDLCIRETDEIYFPWNEVSEGRYGSWAYWTVVRSMSKEGALKIAAERFAGHLAKKEGL